MTELAAVLSVLAGLTIFVVALRFLEPWVLRQKEKEE